MSEDIGGVIGMTGLNAEKGTEMVSLHIGMRRHLLIELVQPEPGSINEEFDDGTGVLRSPGSTRKTRRTESVKKPKLPKTTRVARKPNTDTKGDPSNTKSFLAAFKTEPKCAAYLGYTDIAEYRKFQLSDVLIESYLLYEKHCTGVSSKVALELLSDERTKRSLGDPSQTLADHPLDQRGKDKKNENERNVNYVLASIILNLTENIKKGPPKRTAEDHLLAHDTAVSKLEKAVTQIIPRDYDSTTIQYPVLGPHIDLGEDVLESYNRVYNLLRNFNYTLQPSRWKEKFTALKAKPFESTRVHPSYMPLWMVPVDNVSQSGGLLRKPRPAPLGKKAVKLIWNDQAKTRSAESMKAHIEEFVNYEGMDSLLPTEPTISVKDPRVFPTGQMWRDTLRRQLSFEKLRVEFFTMELQDGDKRMTIYATQGRAAVWDDIRAQLRANDMDVSVTYTLRPLDEGEEFILEYEGPPLALLEDVRLGEDKDVEERPFEPQEDPLLAGITESRQHEEEMAENSVRFGLPMQRHSIYPL